MSKVVTIAIIGAGARGRGYAAFAKEFPDHRFEVISEGIPTELNSILALISLGLSCGTQVVLQVEGVDEEKAVQRIGDLFEYEFDFPEK